MLGVALTHAGVSPSVVVGGEVPDLGTNAELGTSDYLVSRRMRATVPSSSSTRTSPS